MAIQHQHKGQSNLLIVMKRKRLLAELFLGILFFAFGGLKAQQDTVPPVIVYDDTLCIEIGSVWHMQYSVTDNKTSTSNIVTTLNWGFNGPVNTFIRGTYPVTIEATDEDNNKSSLTLNLRVDDCIPPVITLNTPDEVCVKWRTPYNPVHPTVTDNYYPNGQVSLVLKMSDVDVNVKGLYTELYEAIDGSGNKTTKSRLVLVADSCPASSTGIRDVTSSANLIYPQPAGDKINLYLPELGNNIRIKAFSSDGQLILEGKLDDNTTSIETSAWASGIYTLLLSDNTRSFTYKVIIRH